MNYFEDENSELDEEQVIDEFLGEKPRARELRLMRIVWEERRDRMRVHRERIDHESDEYAKFTHQIKEITKQIAVLREEESITEFVENSVRVTLQSPTGNEFD